jgi:hypothetical protein
VFESPRGHWLHRADADRAEFVIITGAIKLFIQPVLSSKSAYYDSELISAVDRLE